MEELRYTVKEISTISLPDIAVLIAGSSSHTSTISNHFAKPTH